MEWNCVGEDRVEWRGVCCCRGGVSIQQSWMVLERGLDRTKRPEMELDDWGRKMNADRLAVWLLKGD